MLCCKKCLLIVVVRKPPIRKSGYVAGSGHDQFGYVASSGHEISKYVVVPCICLQNIFSNSSCSQANKSANLGMLLPPVVEILCMFAGF